MRAIAAALDDALAAGDGRVVLDNTYLSRASRSHVVEAAARHQARTRCLWLDTPLAQAQVNLVLRLLDRVGSLPSPERLRELARREPGILSPTSQMRALRELEPPTLDEGFAEVDRLPFTRSASEAGRTRPGVFVSAAALREPGWKDALRQSDPDAPHLVFDWLPEGAPDALGGLVATVAGEVPGPVEGAVCPHGAGPPVCWCRPPLPGLMLEFARAHAVDPARSVLIGSRTAHRTLATTLGARFVPV
jgi:hypothetical protein